MVLLIRIPVLDKSHLARGAWIEIDILIPIVVDTQVASRERSVD